MKDKAIIDIIKSKKYLDTPLDFRGNAIMVDIVSQLVAQLKDFGDLKTFSGKVVGGDSAQILKIPNILTINIIARSQTQTLEIEYGIITDNYQIQLIIESIIKQYQ